MQKCFTANNEKPSLRLADKHVKEGREQRSEGNEKQMQQQLKIISTILKFIWRKRKTKTGAKAKEKSEQSRFAFLNR